MQLVLALIVAAGPAPLRGQVIDQFGRTRVISVCSSGLGCTQTDKAGRFTFERKERSAVLLQVASDLDEKLEVDADTTDVVLRIRAFPQLTGQIVDEAGAAPEDVVVEDRHVNARFRESFEELPSRVEIRARGLATELVDVPAPDKFGDVSLGRVVLTRGRTVTLQLTDKKTGQPITQARIGLAFAFQNVASVKGSCGMAVFQWLDRHAPRRTSLDGTYSLQLSNAQTELSIAPGDAMLFELTTIIVPVETRTLRVELERK